jgi:hypothetical protein
LLKTGNFAEIKPRPTPEYVPQSWVGRYWWVAGVIVAGVAAVLLSLTRFGFFLNEDFTLISQYSSNQSAGPLGYFTRDWALDGHFYAPLPRIFFWLEYQLFHQTAYGWHVFSTLLHTACAVLVWLLAWRLTRRPALALVAGLFFAALPAHVPVVGQISAQADLWAALFCLASAVTFLYARQTPLVSGETGAVPDSHRSNRFYILSIVFYGLALLSRQEAIALPLALLAFDFVTGGLDRLRHQTNPQEAASDRAGTTISNLLGYYAPYLALLVLYLLIHITVLGGLGIYTNGVAGQGTGLPDFVKDNARTLAVPFALGGTDGLIQIAALLAFLCLTGVQEWEAWKVNNPDQAQAIAVEKAARLDAPFIEDDDELDDPTGSPQVEVVPTEVENGQEAGPVPETFRKLEPTPVVRPEPVVSRPPDDDWELDDPAAALANEAPVQSPPPLAGEDTKAAPVAAGTTNTEEVRPPYWTLRAAGFGFLWTGAFLLPFAMQKMTAGPLYLASAGFVLFLAAALAPFGAATVHRAADKKQARTLFGHFELSFWLRVAAIVVMACVYFATTVGSVTDWNATTRPVGALLKFFL